ncbi:hypothetical protein CIPAW_05G226100 [Carya illinoinensis]|uniref:Uncharacterized protein n=1 Tax=Carya illinoinensis TaxID=32201 RepID=A0A8T1QMC4_CARIL|nr:hypothetical protein CIPAW_05G226100 [Carya illinoinensis]
MYFLTLKVTFMLKVKVKQNESIARSTSFTNQKVASNKGDLSTKEGEKRIPLVMTMGKEEERDQGRALFPQFKDNNFSEMEDVKVCTCIMFSQAS